MPKSLLRAAALAGTALALAACSFDAFTYTIDRYGTVAARHVRLSCKDTYEVFDRPKDHTLLVVTNGVNESLACGSGDAAPRPERMQRVASLFLSETSDRPECRLGAGRPLTEFHTEFVYSCPAVADRRAAAQAEATTARPKSRR
ncbi:MAG: hypothetical protein JWR08_957 [Enterovirga sp.]|nr:hypothetical protein [Enterovirga sp.]